MENLKRSNFQFSNPRIKKVIFSHNDDFDKRIYKGISARYNTEVLKNDENRADVCLNIILGDQSNEVPFYIELEMAASFSWEEETNERADSLLKENGAALLVSYARPFISQLTSGAGYKPFYLPFVDFRNSIEK